MREGRESEAETILNSWRRRSSHSLCEAESDIWAHSGASGCRGNDKNRRRIGRKYKDDAQRRGDQAHSRVPSDVVVASLSLPIAMNIPRRKVLVIGAG